MAKRYLKNKLIHKDKINEELKLINNSNTDYVTPSGKIYCDYGNNMFYPKKTFINKSNGYLYVNINQKDGKQKQKRVHKLVAIAFIPNPNNYPIVMHIDDDKSNPNINNLKWGTISENTKDAYDKGLIKNSKGFENSQSMPVCQFDMNKNLIKIFGSASIAEKETGITKTGILNQCKYKTKTKPRCGYYFRFLNEYKKNNFVL